jgi:hypothetical protein
LPFILQWDESLDIGSDTGTPVDDTDYQTPFTFTGKLNKITLTIDRPKLSPEDIKRLQAAAREAGDGPSVEPDSSSLQNVQAGPIASDTGVGLIKRMELRMDKREDCRKQAEAQNLSIIERLQFIRKCMQ